MSRPSRVKKYNPKLTVEENAALNGVPVSTMRHYILSNGIDRSGDRKRAKIALCKSFWEKNPGATKVAMHNTTGVSITFIREHWEYISNNKKVARKLRTRQLDKKSHSYLKKLEGIPLEEISRYLDAATSKKDKPIRVPNGKELWSDVIKDIPWMLETADKDDVSGLREFLMEKPEMPMLFVGSGGQNGSYIAMLYGMNKGVGMALTPLQFASLSDETVKNSRILLLSQGGKNKDIKYASERAVKLNPDNTACVTTYVSENNHMLENLKGTSARAFVFHHPEVTSGFTSVRGKFYKYGLYYRAFSGVEKVLPLLNISLNKEDCFQYIQNRGTEEPINPEKIEHFCVLYSDYGEPVAHDFESVMTESGLASVQVSDYRNYCHGRFIFPSNFTESKSEPRYRSNVAMVLLVTPRDKGLVKGIREMAIPSKTPVFIIETSHNSALGTIDLLIKSHICLAYIAEDCKRANPYDPYNYNAQDVDKRKPINSISFVNELKANGNLSYIEGKEADTKRKHKEEVDIDALEATISFMKEQEQRYGKHLNYMHAPSVADLTRWEEYDAAAFHCYAFRKKPDLRKGLWIPFGNMNGGFGFDIQGVHFHTSESAYICGMFSENTPEQNRVQEALVASTNGKMAKGDIRYHNEGIARKDWYEFNVDWMLYVVWQKVCGNKEFRDLLLGVPSGANIIEDTSFHGVSKTHDTTQFWGARNPERKEYYDLVEKVVEAREPNLSNAARERLISGAFYEFTDYGTYKGSNVMGKILTICRDCLQKGTEPEINYDLLRNKHIHLLGKELMY